jgi:hypothetical protein
MIATRISDASASGASATSVSETRRQSTSKSKVNRCRTSQTSTRLAEPQIDATLESRLGSEETLRLLIERSTDANVLQAARPTTTARRITELYNRCERASAVIEVDADLVARLVDVFSSWRKLRCEEKRRLLKAFQIRVRVSRPARRVLTVDEVMIGVAGSRYALTISKKLRRYEIQ